MSKTKLIIIFLCAGIVAAASGLIAMNIMEPKVTGNMITKAEKPNPMLGIKGGLTKKEAAIDSSNVMLYCPACEKPTRIKYDVKDGKKVRICKKCGEQIDNL